MKKGKFGEPWKRGQGQHEFVIYAKGWSILRRGSLVDDAEWLQISDRACTCVNALDGIDTDKIQPLMDAVRELIKFHDGENSRLMAQVDYVPNNPLESRETFNVIGGADVLIDKIRAIIGGQDD